MDCKKENVVSFDKVVVGLKNVKRICCIVPFRDVLDRRLISIGLRGKICIVSFDDGEVIDVFKNVDVDTTTTTGSSYMIGSIVYMKSMESLFYEIRGRFYGLRLNEKTRLFENFALSPQPIHKAMDPGVYSSQSMRQCVVNVEDIDEREKGVIAFVGKTGEIKTKFAVIFYDLFNGRNMMNCSNETYNGGVIVEYTDMDIRSITVKKKLLLLAGDKRVDIYNWKNIHDGNRPTLVKSLRYISIGGSLVYISDILPNMYHINTKNNPDLKKDAHNMCFYNESLETHKSLVLGLFCGAFTILPDFMNYKCEDSEKSNPFVIIRSIGFSGFTHFLGYEHFIFHATRDGRNGFVVTDTKKYYSDTYHQPSSGDKYKNDSHFICWSDFRNQREMNTNEHQKYILTAGKQSGKIFLWKNNIFRFVSNRRYLDEDVIERVEYLSEKLRLEEIDELFSGLPIQVKIMKGLSSECLIAWRSLFLSC